MVGHASPAGRAARASIPHAVAQPWRRCSSASRAAGWWPPPGCPPAGSSPAPTSFSHGVPGELGSSPWRRWSGTPARARATSSRRGPAAAPWSTTVMSVQPSADKLVGQRGPDDPGTDDDDARPHHGLVLPIVSLVRHMQRDADACNKSRCDGAACQEHRPSPSAADGTAGAPPDRRIRRCRSSQALTLAGWPRPTSWPRRRRSSCPRRCTWATAFWSSLVQLKFFTSVGRGAARVGELLADDLVQVVRLVVAGDLRGVGVAAGGVRRAALTCTSVHLGQEPLRLVEVADERASSAASAV